MYQDSFIQLLKESLGEDAAGCVLAHLDDEPVVSVRINPFKSDAAGIAKHFGAERVSPVEWSPEGVYLTKRPSFTFDPLFHAGHYYVQEASSMYVGHLFDLTGVTEARVLDLCAAPGGKSTHLLSKMGGRGILVANEVIRNRATILAENISKWGCANCIVTNNDPADFKKLEGYFDIVLVDAPCSGEGMFRKDEKAEEEWSVDNVKLCAARQRRILTDIWSSLKSGGFIIYSTCTFNHFEDEDNSRWISEELGAELLCERHFLPGIDLGEGFYCALLKKRGKDDIFRKTPRQKLQTLKNPAVVSLLNDGCTLTMKGELIKAFPSIYAEEMAAVEALLKPIRSGVATATLKGRDLIPEADLALSPILKDGVFPEVQLDYETAIKYLSREPIILPDAPKGHLLVKYREARLGFVKNIGNRCNNLYPAARRILTGQKQHTL